MASSLAQVLGDGVDGYTEFAANRFGVVTIQEKSEYLLLPRRKLLNVADTHSPNISPKALMSAMGRKRAHVRLGHRGGSAESIKAAAVALVGFPIPPA
jgi:hypothetical protein